MTTIKELKDFLSQIPDDMETSVDLQRDIKLVQIPTEQEILERIAALELFAKVGYTEEKLEKLFDYKIK